MTHWYFADNAYRLPVDKAGLPKIPAHVINYQDAKVLLSKLKGDKAPKTWVGSLKIPYRLGPGFSDSK